MMTGSIENQKELVSLVEQVRDHIRIEQYSQKKVYKWMADKWSSYDIAQVIVDNQLTTKDEVIQYLLDVGHLFGMDR